MKTAACIMHGCIGDGIEERARQWPLMSCVVLLAKQLSLCPRVDWCCFHVVSRGIVAAINAN